MMRIALASCLLWIASTGALQFPPEDWLDPGFGILDPLDTNITGSPPVSPDSVGVTIYNAKFFRGSSLNLTVDKCVSLKDDARFDRRVASVHTQGNCVNMYRSTDCSGTFIRMEPGTPHRDMRNWPGFHESIRSVGPCYDECHSSNIEKLNRTDNDAYVDVTLYSGINRSGKMTEVRLEYNKCVAIPSDFGRSVGSVAASTDACIQIHNRPDCEGEDEMFPTSVPCMRNRLWELWVNRGTYSISLCGYNCLEGRRTYNQIKYSLAGSSSYSSEEEDSEQIVLRGGSADVTTVNYDEEGTEATTLQPLTSRRHSYSRGIKFELPEEYLLKPNDDSPLEMC